MQKKKEQKKTNKQKHLLRFCSKCLEKGFQSVFKCMHRYNWSEVRRQFVPKNQTTISESNFSTLGCSENSL